MRFIGGVGTGLFAGSLRYETNASRSTMPPIGVVPSLKTENPSPPSARKLFIATW